MAFTPISSSNKGHLNASITTARENVSSFWIALQAVKSNGVSKLASTPGGKDLDSFLKKIGQNFSSFGKGLQTVKSKSAHSISSSLVLKNFSKSCKNVQTEAERLRTNVRRNVEALRSNGGRAGTLESVSVPSSSWMNSEGNVSSPEKADLETLRSQSSSIPSDRAFPSDAFADENTPYLDNSSLSSTSVFNIGSIGPTLLGPGEAEHFAFSQEDVLPATPVLAGPVRGQRTSDEASGNLLQLEDVRRFIGNALTVVRHIRSLGFQESSWENKMPWRSPRPAYLAKGLQWPQTRFSSAKERHGYHRKARRRGRYLIGPIPGWSWFAADLVLLYFLINNPAGNFII